MKLATNLSALTGAFLMTSAVTQAATVGLFTGGDVGEGIDFSGNVIHALNLGGGGTGSPAAPDLVVSGVTFRDVYASAALIPDVAANWQAIDNWGTKPSYGAGSNDANLSEVMWDITHGTNTPTLIFTNLSPNQLFRAQVLASDNGLTTGRGNSYELISGDLTTGTVADRSLNNNLTTLQGGALTSGVVVSLMGSSDSLGTLSFRALDATGFQDNNSIASGFILTQVPEPTTGLLSLAGLGLLLRRRRASL